MVLAIKLKVTVGVSHLQCESWYTPQPSSNTVNHSLPPASCTPHLTL